MCARSCESGLVWYYKRRPGQSHHDRDQEEIMPLLLTPPRAKLQEETLLARIQGHWHAVHSRQGLQYMQEEIKLFILS